MLSSSDTEHSVHGPCSPDEQQQEAPRKLAVLGLPWDTTEETLRLHFSQYGAVEATDIMKDRLSGKSRGFGFVTFSDAAAAARALQVDHTIDGRRCEAKVALPKNLLQGEATPAAARTTRIFVARIPQSVTDTQFRSYFEKYGRLQDAYMPRDHSRQMYRGIGFVTFASPESVEKVMACKHWLNGHEVAIDRATPKEDGRNGHGAHGAALSAVSAKLGPNSRRSFDNGAGIVGPGLTPLMTYQQQLNQLLADPAAMAASLAGGHAPQRGAAARLQQRSSRAGHQPLQRGCSCCCRRRRRLQRSRRSGSSRAGGSVQRPQRLPAAAPEHRSHAVRPCRRLLPPV